MTTVSRERAAQLAQSLARGVDYTTNTGAETFLRGVRRLPDAEKQAVLGHVAQTSRLSGAALRKFDALAKQIGLGRSYFE